LITNNQHTFVINFCQDIVSSRCSSFFLGQTNGAKSTGLTILVKLDYRNRKTQTVYADTQNRDFLNRNIHLSVGIVAKLKRLLDGAGKVPKFKKVEPF
jgi:hypothetical protein